MKQPALPVLLLGFLVVDAAYSADPKPKVDELLIKFIEVKDARKELEKRLSPEALKAIIGMHEDRSVLDLDATHPYTGMIRAIVAEIDKRPQFYDLDATVSRRPGTPAAPAGKGMVISRPHVSSIIGKTSTISFPDPASTTPGVYRVELNVMLLPDARENANPPPANSQPVSVAKLMQTVLPDTGNEEVSMVTVDLAPGAASEAHRHPGPVFGYVLEGAIEFQIDGGPLTVLLKGQSFYEPPGAVHRVSRNASATTPAKILAFIVAKKDAPIRLPEK